MDNSTLLLYVPVATLAVTWSLWAYSLWERIPGLDDESSLRTWTLVSGPTAFLVLAFVSWDSFFLPLDWIGMIPLGFVFLLGLLFLLIVQVRTPKNRNLYLITLWGVQILELLVVGFIALTKVNSSVAMVVNLWWQFILEIVSSGNWELIQPVDDAGNLNLNMDRILVALISYVPMSLFRILYTQHLHRRLKKEMAQVKLRMEKLEKELKKDKTDV